MEGMETATAMGTATATTAEFKLEELEQETALETTAMETAPKPTTGTTPKPGATAMRTGVLLAATTLLAACATGDSRPGVPGVVQGCPSPVEYAAEFRERAASEIERLPDDSAIVRLLSDYMSLRQQARSCRDDRSAAQ